MILLFIVLYHKNESVKTESCCQPVIQLRASDTWCSYWKDSNDYQKKKLGMPVVIH